MYSDIVLKIIDYVAIFLALLVVLPLHEFAHAFVAVKCGDLTPKINRRYTLNPFAHLDPLGLVCFIFAHFGWAKPVPVNPNNYKHYKSGCFFVSSAGVIANYMLAFITYPLWLLSLYIPQFGLFTLTLQDTLLYIWLFSLSFFVFNLIPVYPLDGFRILECFCRQDNPVLRFLRFYGRYILLGLFALSVIADFTGFYSLDILGIALGYVRSFISIPISWFWGLIF